MVRNSEEYIEPTLNQVISFRLQKIERISHMDRPYVSLQNVDHFSVFELFQLCSCKQHFMFSISHLSTSIKHILNYNSNLNQS